MRELIRLGSHIHDIHNHTLPTLGWGRLGSHSHDHALPTSENVAMHLRWSPWLFPATFSTIRDCLRHHHISTAVAVRQAPVNGLGFFKTIGALCNGCHPSVINHDCRISTSTTSFRRRQGSISEGIYLRWSQLRLAAQSFN